MLREWQDARERAGKGAAALVLAAGDSLAFVQDGAAAKSGAPRHAALVVGGVEAARVAAALEAVSTALAAVEDDGESLPDADDKDGGDDGDARLRKKLASAIGRGYGDDL